MEDAILSQRCRQPTLPTARLRETVIYLHSQLINGGAVVVPASALQTNTVPFHNEMPVPVLN